MSEHRIQFFKDLPLEKNSLSIDMKYDHKGKTCLISFFHHLKFCGNVFCGTFVVSVLSIAVKGVHRDCKTDCYSLCSNTFGWIWFKIVLIQLVKGVHKDS